MSGRGGRGGGRGGSGGGGRGGGGLPFRPAVEAVLYTQTNTAINEKVKKLEDETAASIKQRHSGVKPENFQAVMPLRPGYGTKGGGFTVFANYFELSTPKELSLHRYNMSILEVGTNKEPTGKKAKRVVQLLILQHFLADRARIVTDFRSNLFCKRALTLGEQPLRVVYWPEEEDEPDANATNVKAYNVKMVASESVLVSSLIDHLASSRADATCATKDETLQALNILFGQHPKDVRNIFNIGASKHFPMNPDQADQHDLGAGLTAIRGYFMSVRPATGRLLVNVQVKHVPCLTPASLGLVIKQWQSSNSSQPARLSIFLKRVRVRVTHIKKTNKDGQTIDRIKTITGLAFPNDGAGTPHPPRVARLGAGPKEVEFWLEAAPGTAGGAGPSSPSTAKSKKPAASATGGKYISVYDFFRRTYPNVRFNTGDENFPVVNVGTKERPSYLPAVVCEVMPGQASGAKLSSNQTAQMINFAVRQAGVNAASIVNAGANLLGFRSPNTPLTEYGVTVSKELLVVPARMLSNPPVHYLGNKAVNPKNGSWNMRDIKFTKGTKLGHWAFLIINDKEAKYPLERGPAFDNTMRLFQQMLKNVGVEANPVAGGLVLPVDKTSPESEIDKTIRNFMTSKERAPPELLLVVLPDKDTKIYNRVKMQCDVVHGLLNVCVVAGKFHKEFNEQYFANVALKFNLKLGGNNQAVDKKKMGLIGEGQTMLVGIDVTHPSPGSASNAPSVASIVASIDSSLGQWPAELRIQEVRTEMVADLQAMMKSRLLIWRDRNRGILPKNIIVYRDGVSEGQYNLVLEHELPALQAACRELYQANAMPKFAIIIVGKRHNTRFYPTSRATADGNANCRNGTVVDRGVTEARQWHFFLQAHAALKGTARPAHYVVIFDQVFRSQAKIGAAADRRPAYENPVNHADVLEEMTHHLCYLFGRATKAVSIVPPAYYADLVCERARCYLSRFFDGSSVGGSDTASQGSGGGGMGERPAAGMVRVHERIRDTMFYI